MYNVNTIKKNILDRLNAQIKETRDSKDSHIDHISSSISNHKNKSKQEANPTRQNDLKSKFHSIMQDNSSKSAVSSRNSLTSKDRDMLKSNGKIRELLAKHRLENEKQVQKPPWMGRNGPSQSNAYSAHSSKHSLANSVLAGAVKLPPLLSSKTSIQSKPTSDDVFSRLYRPKSVKSIKSTKSSPSSSTHSLRKVSLQKSKPLPSLTKKKNIKRVPSSSAVTSTDQTSDKSDDEESQEQDSDSENDSTISTSKPTSAASASHISKATPTTSCKEISKPKWSLFGSKSNKNDISKESKSTPSPTTTTIPKKPLIQTPIQKPIQTPKQEQEEIMVEKAPNVNIKRCKNCQRPFAVDRIEKHENICKKLTKSKQERGNFDSSEMRIKGTELDQYKNKKRVKSAPKESKKPKSNWKKTHEEFINSMREAKKLQAHLAKGGKLSDLPPVTSKSTNDGKPCPHCGRKFSESAFERHSNICKNLRH